MSHTIRILPRAERDFRHIHSYIRERSEAGAIRWRHGFEKGLRRVAENPFQFGFAVENELSELDIRQCIFRTKKGLRYRAVFTVVDDEVIVLRIRGPGQPPLAPDEMPLK